MKYLGSKNRIAKELVPIILKDWEENVIYYEPFVGGCNMIDKIPPNINRIGADSHPYLIALLKAVQNGWEPPSDVSEDMYISIKANPENYHQELVGFVGFCCSFSGKYFGGYARDKTKRNYAREQSKNLVKQSTSLEGINLMCCSYSELKIDDNSIVYCDPPYRDTAKYKDSIDYDHFYQWCKELKNRGCKVFVSEYDMPEEFECVWEKTTHVNFASTRNSSSKRTEKLFKL